MSVLETQWFIASEKDAKKLAGVVIDDEGSFEAWPSLHLKLGEMELQALWTVMRGSSLDTSDSVAADLLLESPEGEVMVIKVAPGFVKAIAGLPAEETARVAEAWAKDEFSAGLEAAELAEIVGQIRVFAGQSLKEKKPVLQLVTMSLKS